MHYTLDILNKPITVFVHDTIHMALSMDTIISTKFTYPVVMEVTIFGRDVEVATSRKLPNKMVAGLFDIARHTDIF